MYLKVLLLQILALLYLTNFSAQTLIINEVSQGESGNMEFIEFVVVDNSAVYDCGDLSPPTIDIRGWIIDDNNGYHSPASEGVAGGAVRFSNDVFWSAVPLGTIILVYNPGDISPSIPADDISLSDGNCHIVVPINNTSLFESNNTTPGDVACSYPGGAWTAGGTWNNIVLRNGGDCARILDLAGCEVFSVCWGDNNQNTQVYFGGSASNTVYYFNDTDPTSQINWSSGCSDNETALDATTCGSNDQTPGSPNNAANADYIAQFNNGCAPITPIATSALSTDASCGLCDGTATGSSSGSIPGYTYAWYDASYNSIGQNTAAATALCPGTYHVISSSSISCADTATAVISAPGGPSAPIAGADAIYCFGDALVDLTASGSGGLLTWYDDIGLTNVLGSGGTLTPTNAAGATTHYVTETIAGCESPPALVTITIAPLPTATLSGGGTICSGDPIPDMTVTLTGTAPWSLTYTDGVTPVTVPGIMTSPYTISGAADGTYVLSAVSDASCTGTFSGAADIITIPLPTATLTGGGTICSGDAIPDMTVTLTGIAPWSITYTDGLTPLTVPGIMTSPYTISGAADGSYVLSAVSDASCTGTFSGSADIITTPLPTATLTGGGTICSGDPIPDMTVTLTGTAPWSLTYTDGVTPVTVPGIMTSPYTISGASDGSYVLSAVSDASCTGTFSGSADIITTPLPTATIAGGGAYCFGTSIPDMTVTLTGTAPWSITYTDGVTPLTVAGIMTSPYTISGAADGSYILSAVSDASCIGTFSGSADIITTPLPTATIAGGGAYCFGTSIPDMTVTLTGTAPWSITYTDGVTPVTVPGIMTSPYTISGAADGTYVLSAVSDASCTGTFSGSADIITTPLPTAMIAGGGTYCFGTSIPDMTVTLTGTAPWSITYTDGVTPLTVAGIMTSPYTISGAADGSYILSTVSDANCTGTFSGAADIITIPLPTATIAGGGTYCFGTSIPDMTVTLTGTTPWSITYTDGVTPVTVPGIMTSPYTISVAADGSYVLSAVSDANCIGTFSGAADIITIPLPTATIAGGGTYCFGTSIPDITVTLTGTAPWSITYTDGVTPVTVPGIMTSPYTISGAADGTYVLSAVSDASCTGTFSGSADIITIPLPTATLTGGGTICSGDAIPDLTITLTGTAPWSITYTDGITPLTVSGIMTSPYTISVAADGSYVLSAVSDANCIGTFSGAADIITIPLPTATIAGGGTYCFGTSIPDITVTLTGTAPWSITYTDGVTPVTVPGIMTSPYTISGAADGTYVLSAVSDASCTGTFSGSADIITTPLPLAPAAGVDATYCIGDPIIDLFAAGGGGVLTWYSDMGITIEGTGTAFSPINSVGVFTYYVSEEMNGCTGPLSLVNVAINDVPTIDSEVAVNVSGCNITDGSITIVASGGLPPYSYSIDGGTTFTNSTGIFTGLDVNSYQVVVADVNCQTVGSLLVITGPGIPSAPAAGTDATYCDGDFIVDLTAVIGSGGTLSWYADAALTNLVGSNVTFSPSNAVGAATYYVTETVTNCESASTQITITVNPTPLAPVTSGDNTYCEGDLIADLTATPAAGGVINWYDDAGLTNLVFTGQVYSPPSTVGASVYYAVESLNGCEGPPTLVTVTINELLTIDSEIGVDATGCGLSDGTITITASGGTGTYNFSIDGGSTFPNTTGVFTGLGVNSYQVEVTDGNCSVAGNLLTISAPSTPAAPTASVSSIYCDGDVVSDLTTTPGSGGLISWYDDAALTNLIGTGNSYSPATAVGNYTYYITETVSGCESPSSQLTIDINPTPLAPILLGGATYCESDQITDLQASPGGVNSGTFYWFDDAGLTNNTNTGPVYSPPTTIGSYTYYIVDSLNGCVGPSASVNIIINALPSFTIATSDPTICGGTNGFITIEGLNSNTTYDVQYSIDGNAQPLVSLTSDINGDILISNLTQGSYSDFTLTINGCSYTDLGPYVLTDPSVPVFNVVNPIDPSGCGTVDGTITISGLTTNTTYNLTYNLNGSLVGPNSITTDINGDFIITGLSDGVYDNFTVDLNGCVGSSAVMITLSSIIPLAPNALGDSTYCEGEVMVDLSVLPAVGGEINWYADNLLTNQVAVNTTTFTPPTAPGIYTYWITETLNGCEGDTTSVTVEVVALPLSPLAGNDTSYCESQSIIDITATAQGAGTLAWYSDADLTNLIGTGSSLSPFAAVGSIVYYIVEVNGNCIGTYDSIVVNIDPAPVADFTATPTTGTSPLLVDFTDNSTGAGISYSWDFGDGITYFEQDTMNTYYSSGSFISSLTVSDTNGCTDTYSLIITIENPPVPVDSSHIIVPNIFTPNGDYENDFFKLNTNNILELEGTIFNRWGQVVFIVNTVEGGWNGRTVAGIECAEGTYYYLIHALGGDGVEYNFQGPFELIR